MNITKARMRHPNDGWLIRLLDREVDDLKAVRLRRHLAGCPECARRYHNLRAASEFISQRLLEIDVRPPEGRAPPVIPLRPRRGRGRSGFTVPAWGRAAAAVALLATTALAVPPVRAWVSDQWQRLAGGPRAEETTPAPGLSPTGPATAPADAREAVAFAPLADRVTISLERLQTDGVLWLRALEVDEFTVAEHGRSDAGLTVLPDAVHLDNRADGVGGYVVTVPSYLGEVRVRIAGGPVEVIPVRGAAPWIIRYDLRTGERVTP